MASVVRSLESEAQRHSRRRLARFAALVTRLAHGMAGAEDDRRQKQAQLDELEAGHPEFVTASTRYLAGFAILLAAFAAVYGIDVLLFGATAVFFAAQVFGEGSIWLEAARFSVPAGILLIEVAIAAQLFFSREDAEEEGTGRGPSFFWVSLGLLFALVMPAAVIATTHAVRSGQTGTEQASLAPMFRWQTISLAALALTAHLGVLFGGRPAHDSKAYTIFSVTRFRLRRGLRRLASRMARISQEITGRFARYVQELHEHNRRYQPVLEPGPFDAVTRRTLNGVFGYVIVAGPGGDDEGGGGPAPVPAAADPGPTAPPAQAAIPIPTVTEQDAAGETEYLHAALVRDVRERESEVRP